MKSTYLPNDEQIARIKKEIDLLKMRQELDGIKQRQSGVTQSAKPQNPQNYESQYLQIQDSRNNGTNQSTQRQDSQQYRVSNNGTPSSRSGVFMGVDVGYGNAKLEASMLGISADEANGGVNWGVTLGYNYFLTNYFGVRIYASANAQLIRFDKAMTALMASNHNIMSIAWGGNADLIVNFVATKNFDFGVYAGVFIGANSYINRDLYDLEIKGFNPQYTCFDIGLNVGLRTMIDKNIGIEISARVPFIKSKILDNAPAANLITGAMGTFSISGKQNYNVNARFLYMF